MKNLFWIGVFIGFGLGLFIISAGAQIVDPLPIPEPGPTYVECVEQSRRHEYTRNREGYDLIFSESRGCLIPAHGVELRATST